MSQSRCSSPQVITPTVRWAAPSAEAKLVDSLPPGPTDSLAVRVCRDESGASTAEYAITVLAAAGFAGLLVVILQSDTVRGWLEGIIGRALSQ